MSCWYSWSCLIICCLISILNFLEVFILSILKSQFIYSIWKHTNLVLLSSSLLKLWPKFFLSQFSSCTHVLTVQCFKILHQEKLNYGTCKNKKRVNSAFANHGGEKVTLLSTEAQLLEAYSDSLWLLKYQSDYIISSLI